MINAKKKLKISGIHMSTRHWFNLLKEPYKTAAFAELKTNPYRLDSIRSSLVSALQGFNWNNSIKGTDYWDNICSSLLSGDTEKFVNSSSITQYIN